MRPETIGEGIGSGMDKSREGKSTVYSGTVDDGKKNLGQERPGNRGRERSITRFPVCVCRPVLIHSTFLQSRPLPRAPLLNYQPPPA